MQIERFCEGLLSFLQASPTPFHAVQTMALALEQTGFQYLDEADDWNYPTSGNYYTIRNDASIIAFRLGQDDGQSPSNKRLGFNMVGAHTDSPGLKIKPNPDQFKEHYWQLGVEVYGSPLLHTWFDRDLSLAGRVHYVDENHGLYRTLIDFEQPVATIPSLAIHLNRTANDKSSINAQKHVLPVLMQTESTESFSLKAALLERLKLATDHMPQEVLDFDLYLYDSQPPRTTGFAQEFIASARLDNLLSCYVGLMSLLNSDPNQRSLLVCNDHEEVGSQSACGAQGPFLADTLKRLFPDYETYCQSIAQSFLISVDNAHAIHPNYADRHDPKHAPRMNHGPAIKINANQRYATTSETSAVVQYLAQVVKVPIQSFVSRSDLACGSTIGPLTSAEVGVRTVDMGVPQFAMHSARELASKADSHALYQLLNAFFSLPAVPSAQAIRPDLQGQKPAEPAPAQPEDHTSEPNASRSGHQRGRSSRSNPSRQARGSSQSSSDQQADDRRASSGRHSSSDHGSNQGANQNLNQGPKDHASALAEDDNPAPTAEAPSVAAAAKDAGQNRSTAAAPTSSEGAAQASNTHSNQQAETENTALSAPTSEASIHPSSETSPEPAHQTTQGSDETPETHKSKDGSTADHNENAPESTVNQASASTPATQQETGNEERRTRPNRGRGRGRPNDKRRRNNDRNGGRNRNRRNESAGEQTNTTTHQSENTVSDNTASENATPESTTSEKIVQGNTASASTDTKVARDKETSTTTPHPAQTNPAGNPTDAKHSNIAPQTGASNLPDSMSEAPAAAPKDGPKAANQPAQQTEPKKASGQAATTDPIPTPPSASGSRPENSKPEAGATTPNTAPNTESPAQAPAKSTATPSTEATPEQSGTSTTTEAPTNHPEDDAKKDKG